MYVISNKTHDFTGHHSSSVTSFPLTLAFFYSAEIKSSILQWLLDHRQPPSVCETHRSISFSF